MKLDYSKLPKANLFSVRIVRRCFSWGYIRTRGANFGAIYLGPLMIVWRMPWLPDVAVDLYPHAVSVD